MAISNSSSRIQYQGNNSTVTPYVIPFYFLESSDIVVAVTTSAGVETTLTPSTDYTVSGAGNEAGGSLVTTAAIATTSTVTISREVPLTQQTEFQEGSDFPSATHERALDKAMMAAQQINRRALRSIRVRESDGERNPLAAVANTLIGLDANKQPKAMTVSEVKTFLALSGVTLDVDAGTKTFADSGERDLSVPDFIGQIGTQRDTGDIYISDGTAAGDWVAALSGITLASFANNLFTADTAGRAPFADGLINASKLASDAVTTAKILDANVTAAKLAATLDLSGKTLTMPANHWINLAPTGAVLQTLRNANRTALEVSASIPNDDTIPQISEGGQLLSVTITPFSSSSTFLIRYGITAHSNGDPNAVISAIFRTGTNNALSSDWKDANTSDTLHMAGEYIDSPATASAVTYSVRIGTNGANLQINQSSAGQRRLGGTWDGAWMIVQELK